MTTKRQLSREGREVLPAQPNINISIEQPVEVGGAGWSRVLLCVAGGGGKGRGGGLVSRSLL